MNPDIINGLFEFIGAAFLLMNCQRLLKDRTIKGVAWQPTAFFGTWGIWNLYYYPHLDQMFSFFGGVALVIMNALWLALVLMFWWRDKNRG